MRPSTERLTENLATVRSRIAEAAHHAGRSAADVVLVAVVKEVAVETVLALVDLGVHDLGEGQPQQLWERSEQIGGPVRWHLVGHLQRNKARRTLPLVEMIHSADSLPLLQRLDELARELNLRPRVFLEVNASREPAKHGFVPEQLPTVWDDIVALEHLRIEGLMTMAAWAADPEEARPTFALVRQLRDGLQQQSPSRVEFRHLSMGMSSDFEVAIEEGATMVRLGTAIFAP